MVLRKLETARLLGNGGGALQSRCLVSLKERTERRTEAQTELEFFLHCFLLFPSSHASLPFCTGVERSSEMKHVNGIGDDEMLIFFFFFLFEEKKCVEALFHYFTS